MPTVMFVSYSLQKWCWAPRVLLPKKGYRQLVRLAFGPFGDSTSFACGFSSNLATMSGARTPGAALARGWWFSRRRAGDHSSPIPLDNRMSQRGRGPDARYAMPAAAVVGREEGLVARVLAKDQIFRLSCPKRRGEQNDGDGPPDRSCGVT